MTDVFVHHDGALGDVLLSLPCFNALREEGTRLHLAARTDVGRLLKETGCVDGAVSADSGLFAPLYGGVVDGRAGEFLSRFDRAFVFTHDADARLTAAVASVVPAARAVRTFPPPDERTHAAEFRFRQLGGGAPFPIGTLLPVPQAFLERADALLARAGYDGRRPLLAFHPGSGGRAKCWPPARFEELGINILDELEAYLAVVTGPAEDGPVVGRMERLARSRKRVLHLRNAELSTVAAVLGRARFFAGNDSGISHLAAAVGCPSVVLFGPTDPAVWKPMGNTVTVLVSTSLDAISVDRVMASFAERAEAQSKSKDKMPAERFS